MAEFAVVNEWNIVTNIIVADSFEEADALTEDTCHQVSEVGIGFIYIPEEQRFVSPEDYQLLIADKMFVADMNLGPDAIIEEPQDQVE